MPRVGHVPLQALHPTVISKLYRDLANHGGHNAENQGVSHVCEADPSLTKWSRSWPGTA